MKLLMESWRQYLNETYEFTGEVQTVSAKLFIFDYTNIRGSSNSEVCMSPTVDWRATTA